MDIPEEVADKLGYYVYLYVDPRDRQIKYVGKGVGHRAIQHREGGGKKGKWLKDLQAAGKEPQIDILARNLTEAEALLVERCVIDAIGIPPLTNAVRGHDVEQGREPLNEIIIREQARPAEIRHRVILFRLNKYFKLGMTDGEIYEGTRGVWKIGKCRAEKAEYAFGVVNGIVRGVYTVDEWFPGGTKPYCFRPPEETDHPERWEFVGEPAPQRILDLYLHKSVRDYLPEQGGQSPFVYEGL